MIKTKTFKDLRKQNQSASQQLQRRFEKHRCLAILIQGKERRMPRCSLSQGTHIPSASGGTLTYEIASKTACYGQGKGKINPVTTPSL